MKLIYSNFLLEFNILASFYLNYLKLCLAHLITQYFFIMPNPFSIYEKKKKNTKTERGATLVCLPIKKLIRYKHKPKPI